MQLQTTISFEMEHISFEMPNKLFNVSHVSHVFQKHTSIKAWISPAFSG